ncbi:endonuclease/exonuclease/phosphatase family protein [Micromonospora sp. NBC_01796]|uniref:endonuclease/exonuclease/phosphatase family protein n=1 Tax=Micromonospora sp. NBC_01796 TaxID=2975987 RepID=UPI002DD892E4|nr:endonuclease/exonuclease/phosphatase family protein [Micromonospora sp. NBC_01796]WSA84656.1 endonuclease/exonuclease/phosphatase family protein [Micromonospora sp. NBC_01796]
MSGADRRSAGVRAVAVLGVLLLLVAAVAGQALVRPGPPRAEVEPAPGVRAFCPEAGRGPCAELGGLDGAVDRRDPDLPSAPPEQVPFGVLQLNLCNSGFAGCYAALNNGRAVEEAYATITALRPQVVTLNEICRDDVATALHPAMVRNFPDDQVFWAFQPAGDLPDGARPYRCRNGDEYGIGILGRVPSAHTDAVSVFNGLYPDQGGYPDEMRVWLCVAAPGAYYACTTHLTYISPSIAMRQCRRLLDVELPAMRATVGSAAPVVVAGDFNLASGGSPDVRDCVPAGYHHTGDGGVQQLMTSTDLGVPEPRSHPMQHTDHPGWFVGFQP